MTYRHSFYFCICTGLDDSRDQRIGAIVQCAQQTGLNYTKNEIADCITIQVETDSDDKATLFKLCSEVALDEYHKLD